MQYQVPQFIEVEDKIVGPLTIKQFLYLAAAFLVGLFSFFILKFIIWLIFTILVSGIALAFAFVKYNGQPLSSLLRSMFNYFWKPRRYIWQKSKIDIPLQKSDLEDLSLKLNTFSKPLKGEKPFKLPFLQRLRKIKEKYEVFRKVTGERDVARRVDYR